MPCVTEVVNRSLKADCTDYTFSYGVLLGIMMMNMSEIRFETSFITVLDYVIYYFSLTPKCIPVVYIFVPIITLSV